ncbi:antitoxin [Xanthomonas graminis]|nr:antitoxin [Xanthomonas translucens]UKE71480.1 antitoxin [Xanthomonas translucens pv. phleipratensis]
MIKLDPRVSQFESTEAAEDYDRWFRAKIIERAVADAAIEAAAKR